MNEPRKRSKYAEKKAKGNMMYGPGCCAHTLQITQEMRMKMNERKREVERQSRLEYERKVFRNKFGNL